MKIRILTSAIDDLNRGYLFYENQMPDLGDYFLNSLFSDIDSLALNGGIHLKFEGYYRMLSKRFPYAVYYKIDNENTVIVWRVLDMRRDPEKNRHDLSIE
jgi:plasmid stabilization system protein ParE